MTELLLDEAFYKAEVRSDYYVSEEMKHIWAVGLDLWQQFDSVVRDGEALIQFAGNII